MSRTILCSARILCALLTCASVAGAQTSWNAGTGDWHDPGNWSAGVPVAGVDAIVSNGGTPEIGSAAAAADVVVTSGNLRVLGGGLSCDNISMTGGSALDLLGGTVSVLGSVQVLPGTITASGASLSVQGGLDLDGTATLDGSSIDVLGGDLEVSDLFVTNTSTVDVAGQVDVSGALDATNGGVTAGGSGTVGTCSLQGTDLAVGGSLVSGSLTANSSTVATGIDFTVSGLCRLESGSDLSVGWNCAANDLDLTGGSTLIAVGDLAVSGAFTSQDGTIAIGGGTNLGGCDLLNSQLTVNLVLASGNLSGVFSGVSASAVNLIGNCVLTDSDLQTLAGDLQAGDVSLLRGTLSIGGDLVAAQSLTVDQTDPFDVLGGVLVGGNAVLSTVPNASIGGAGTTGLDWTQVGGDVTFGGALTVGGSATGQGGTLIADRIVTTGSCFVQGGATWGLSSGVDATSLVMNSANVSVFAGDITVVTADWTGSTVSVAGDCDVSGPGQLTNTDFSVGGRLTLASTTVQSGSTVNAVLGSFLGSYTISQGALSVLDLEVLGPFIILGGTNSLAINDLYLGPSSSLRPEVDATGLSPLVTDVTTLGGLLVVTDNGAALGPYDLVTATTSISGSFASENLPGPEWWTQSSSTAYSLEKGPPDNVAAIPDGDCLSVENVCETVPFVFSKFDVAEARAVSVTFELSSELGLCADPTTSIRQGTWLSGFTSAFQVLAHGGGVYTADQTILGFPCGNAAGGELFVVDVAAAGGDGIGTITVTSVSVRDCQNATLPGHPGARADLTIDQVPPVTVTDLQATQKRGGNDADGTTQITLDFTVPVDADEVLVYRKGFGDYPEYDDGTGQAPAAPATPADATLDGWTLTPLTNPGQADDPGTRDFWYYVVFTKDACDNVSAVSNLTPGTLNYHLGDVTDGAVPGQGDNAVNSLDISLLGSHYGATLSFGDPVNYLDVGPTTDFSVNARPTTDDVVDFEDLVVFAMNYGDVGRSPASPVVLEGRPTVALVQAPDGGMSLVLQGHVSGVRGVRAKIGFDRRALQLLGCEPGELLHSAGATFLETLDHETGAFVDLAVLGQGAALAGSGELARLTFGGSADEVHLLDADLRGPNNERLGGHVLPDPAAANGADSELPGRLELVGARPNPFERATEIVFRLPAPHTVSLTIHDVGGRLVRSLENGRLPAGEHRAVWDGRTERGTAAGAGIYFYTFRAGDHHETRKILHVR